MSATDLAIDLNDVAKVYKGKVHALRGIQMQVHRGEVFGLLGPNGAGKSTLVKIMMTVVHPTRAAGTILGERIGHKPTLARVGYLPEHHRLPQYLTGRQTIDYFGAITNVPRAIRRQRAEALLDLMKMSSWADDRVSTYSKGMMQRVGIAAALINEPDLLVLDEPTDGVDPVGRREIRDAILNLKREGKTIFLNSHLLSELEMVCDRVAILVQGQVAMQGTVDSLTRESHRIELIISGDSPPSIADFPNARTEKIDHGLRIVLPGGGIEGVQPLIDRVRSEGRMIRSLRPIRESLEELFMRAVTDPATGKAHEPGATRSKP